MITPHQFFPSLAAALAVPAVFFKREDLHPYGSHKGRSLPHMIDTYAAQGKRAFCIASSGNAALAAALHITLLNTQTQPDTPFSLKIFIGNHIDQSKASFLNEIQDPHITVEKVERPLQAMAHYVKEHGCTPLRQSTDDLALEGYAALAEELKAIPNLQAIFIAASSGTTAQALAAHLPKVELNIAQTTSCHPIAEYWGTTYHPESCVSLLHTHKEESVARAIVDRVGHRRKAVADAVGHSGGSCWIINNAEIEAAQALALKTTGLTLSANSALSVAALMKALDEGTIFEGSVVCLICGR